MGLKERDKTDTTATQQAMPNETSSSMAKESLNPEKRSPDARRRALIVGLATTPVLLSLMNRSALAQNANCSLLSSIILGGGSVEEPREQAIQEAEEKWRRYCSEDGAQNGNSGNSGTGGTSGD